jgi:integrase
MENGGKAGKGLYYLLMKVCHAEGFNNLTTHSFRHTFIQNHLRAGVNFKQIMRWSGHADIKTFMVYLNAYEPDDESIDKMDYGFLNKR